MRARLGLAVTLGLLLVPAALLLVLSFRSAGVGPGATAVAAAAVGALCTIRVALGGSVAPTRSQLVSGGALAALALWSLLSALWSDSTARALIEYDRVLLYLFVFVLLATVPHTAASLRWLIRGLFAAVLTVCLVSLASRVLPGLVPVDSIFDNRRLRYPLESWNGMGLLASLGIVLAVHHTASDREHRVVHLAAAAAVPLLVATLILTYSRGAVAAAALGIAAYVLLARQRNLLPGLLIIVPASLVAAVATFGADQLAGTQPASAAASAQGRTLLVILLGTAAAAALLRTLLARTAVQITLSPIVLRRVIPALAAAGLIGLLVVAVTQHIPQRALANVSDAEGSRRHDDVQGRFRYLSLNRNVHWDVALDAWSAHPVLGTGAGTFELLYDRRPGLYPAPQIDGHSLYIEALGELGLVGLALILVVLVPILAALGRRIRGPDRAVYAAALAAVLAWMVHAGVNWDWETTALTAWIFAVGGLVLGRRDPVAAPRPRRLRLRVAAAVACTGLLVVPVLLAVSEQRLQAATRALLSGDCRSAVARADNARAALSVRPEPHTVLGLCALRSQRPTVAARHFERARERDPGQWKPYYGLALARAMAGRDATALISGARVRNPTDPVIEDTARRLARAQSPRLGKQIAAEAPLPVADQVLGHGQRFEIWRPLPEPGVIEVLPTGELLG